jgi:hypothetical protein
MNFKNCLQRKLSLIDKQIRFFQVPPLFGDPFYCALFHNETIKENYPNCIINIRYAIIVRRVGNVDATLVLRCLSEPESKADLKSVKISELAQKLTEIATFLQSGD